MPDPRFITARCQDICRRAEVDSNVLLASQSEIRRYKSKGRVAFMERAHLHVMMDDG